MHFRALLGRFVSDFARKPAKLSVQWRWLVGLLLLKAMFGCVATCSTERLSRVNSHVHTTTAIGSMFSRVRVFGLFSEVLQQLRGSHHRALSRPGCYRRSVIRLLRGAFARSSQLWRSLSINGCVHNRVMWKNETNDGSNSS